MKCTYCGEREAQVRICDPNGGLEDWDVCLICENVIRNQMHLSMGHILEHLREGSGKKLIDEAKANLKEIANETGVEPFTFIANNKERDKK